MKDISCTHRDRLIIFQPILNGSSIEQQFVGIAPWSPEKHPDIIDVNFGGDRCLAHAVILSSGSWHESTRSSDPILLSRLRRSDESTLARKKQRRRWRVDRAGARLHHVTLPVACIAQHRVSSPGRRPTVGATLREPRLLIGRPGRTRSRSSGTVRVDRFERSKRSTHVGNVRTNAAWKRASTHHLVEAMDDGVRGNRGCLRPGQHRIAASGEAADGRESRGTRNDATGVRHLLQRRTDDLGCSVAVLHLPHAKLVRLAPGRESQRRGKACVG